MTGDYRVDMSNTGHASAAAAPAHAHAPLRPWDVGDEGLQQLIDGVPSGLVVHARYESLQALNEETHPWPVEATQLRPGQFVATDVSIRVGSMRMSRLRCNLPVTLRITASVGSVSIILPAFPGASFLFRGRPVVDQCVLVRGAAELELMCATPLDAVTICVSEDDWYSDRGEHRVSHETLCSPVVVMDPGSQWMAHVWTPAESLRVAGVRPNLLAASMLSTCVRKLPQSLVASDEPRLGSRRAIVIEEARRFIHHNLATPLRVATVCAAIGVQARTLEYGFREMLGMSPVSYIKAVRLNRVQRLLLSCGAERRTITELAMDCGFWHLSQFAADYQRFFGESPSASRRRARVAQTTESHPQLCCDAT